MGETLSALEWADTSVEPRYVGVSNYSAWQTARAYSLLEQSRIPLTVDQSEYSLVCRSPEVELADAAVSLGVGLLPWSPLGHGVLTGKYPSGIPSGSRAVSPDFPGFAARFLDERARRIADAVATAARGLRVEPAEVALAWVRDRPAVTAPIVGSRTLTQLRCALSSLQLVLPLEIADALDEVSAT